MYTSGMRMHFACFKASCLFLVRPAASFSRVFVEVRKPNASSSCSFLSFNWRCIFFLYFSRAVTWTSISKRLVTGFKAFIGVFFLGLCIINNYVLSVVTLITLSLELISIWSLVFPTITGVSVSVLRLPLSS